MSASTSTARVLNWRNTYSHLEMGGEMLRSRPWGMEALVECPPLAPEAAEVEEEEEEELEAMFFW